MEKSAKQPKVQPKVSQPPVQSVSKVYYSGSRLRLVLLIIILLATLVGGVYYSGIKQNKLNKQTAKNSPMPTVANLNPNTGNLYNDLKVRLNEVIK